MGTEKIVSGSELAQHRLPCRVKSRLHQLTHRYLNYELAPPDGRPAITVVTYAPRVWPWSRTWTCWLRPSPDSMWERHTVHGFAARMQELTSEGCSDG